MRKFKVTIEGENLHLEMERIGKFGVLAVRFVEAIDEVLAIHTALEDFRCDPKGKALHERLLNPLDDPPLFEATEIAEIESFECNGKPLGLIFYPEDSDEGSYH